MSIDPNNLQKHLTETDDLERTFLFLYGKELERVFTFDETR